MSMELEEGALAGASGALVLAQLLQGGCIWCGERQVHLSVQRYTPAEVAPGRAARVLIQSHQTQAAQVLPSGTLSP